MEHADAALQTALRSLNDIVLPDPVSMMPQTWGWLVVAALLTAACTIAVFRWVRRYRADAYRREALAMLGTIRHLLEHPTTRREGVLRLGVLLKRTALAAWPRSEVASLSNADWAEFLANHGDTDTRTLEWLLTDFEYHDADAVAHLPSHVRDDVLATARAWIERHHVPA
ncbi:MULTISPECIES: DUF4381 domain-containing protein [unclassified Rhizobium]|uniref:DUF4381 domain-containing protein n=1 Tax=unclassified Rhizobium TaxID=2613769 RepID=UPI001FD0D08F|nr:MULTISPECIES: DUF4381 domain-containing protein [unclassified Rhizobium]